MGAIHKFKGEGGRFDWQDVAVQCYPRARDVSKHELIGESDGARNFAVRYFEVAPGGRTSLDEHTHDHGVVVVRGKGRVLLGRRWFDISFGDAIYVEPNETHQFENEYDEALGFICVIPPKERKEI